jgi:hypothetical protein
MICSEGVHQPCLGVFGVPLITITDNYYMISGCVVIYMDHPLSRPCLYIPEIQIIPEILYMLNYMTYIIKYKYMFVCCSFVQYSLTHKYVNIYEKNWPEQKQIEGQQSWLVAFITRERQI